jgi:N-acetylglucosamine repressor
MRDINRQIVLNYVRERGPISRAEIARETVLQRSTISTIVDALVADRLVEEIGEGESTGGRRPTMLRLRASGAVAVGVDITPTQTIVATSDLAGRVLERVEFATHPDFEKTISRAIECVLDMKKRHGEGLGGVGVILPGLVDPLRGKALYIPYFNWRDLEVSRRVSSATGLSVMIDNDANAAALAELWFGRPEVSSARDFIMVFVSEGVGTGIIFDGQVYRGAVGAAGEFGHMIIGHQAPVVCSCGSRDCWEAFASGRAALARRASLLGEAGRQSEVNFAELIDRALDGEEAARTSLIETAKFVSIGISNLIVGLSPELVVVGGSISRAWPLLAGVFGETVERSVRRGLTTARIVASTLGEQTTLMGALSLVLANKFAYASSF